ncbi:MAG: hypothetical protein HYV60_13170 [Planctomycetia bacterium]|nr:hypothetical protein [Planctomycetia bacterium]
MATKDQRRQKKLERKNAKRKAVHKELVRQKQGGLAAEFARIANAPIVDCLVADSLWEHGIGMVLLSRELRNGQVAFANFLVDAYCLGVKDVHAEIRSKPSYRDDVRGYLLERGSYQEVSPSHLRKLVESAVAYALDLGFAPHKDYRIGKELFGSIDASACDTEFEFGRDGKPCFIAGPHDTPERSQRIANILSERCGPDNFHFTIEISPGDFQMLEDDSDVIDADEWEEVDDVRHLGS